jgi:alkane 1-monooxygenase
LVGWLSAISTAHSHELIHKKTFFDKMMGQWNFSKRFYGHYYLDHVNSHHKKVGTLEDHSTAFKNESLYAFILRSIWGQLKGVYAMEIERISKFQGNAIKYVIYNALFYHFLVNITIVLVIYHLLGLNSVRFQFIYCIYAITYNQITDYMEHYGIVRKKDKNGIYESISKFHSWNAKCGPILAKLERHSDHHLHGYRPYQLLQRLEEEPFIPYDFY